MKTGQNKPRAIAIPQEYRRMRFSWVDLLVVVAVLLTLAVVVDAATGRAKAAPTSTPSLITAEAPRLRPGAPVDNPARLAQGPLDPARRLDLHLGRQSAHALEALHQAGDGSRLLTFRLSLTGLD
eukprot:gene9529-12741_t